MPEAGWEVTPLRNPTETPSRGSCMMKHWLRASRCIFLSAIWETFATHLRTLRKGVKEPLSGLKKRQTVVPRQQQHLGAYRIRSPPLEMPAQLVMVEPRALDFYQPSLLLQQIRMCRIRAGPWLLDQFEPGPKPLPCGFGKVRQSLWASVPSWELHRLLWELNDMFP
jgi:hypothetical protein